MSERTFHIDYLAKLSEIINKYAKQWQDNSINPSDLNTEMELLTNLNGLSRLIENVMRIAIEFKNGIRNEKYYNVLTQSRASGSGLNQDGYHLFIAAKRISDGLVHSDYEKVETQTDLLYKHPTWKKELEQKKYSPDKIFKTTFTSKGTILDVSTGKATDSEGSPIPVETFIPRKSKKISENFSSFLITGSFFFTYDVLLLAFKKAIIYRDEAINP